MRDYSKVSSAFWTGKTGKALRGNHQAQVVALYLMTCPHANMIGVFHCPIIYIAHETGSSIEGATKGLNDLIEGAFCTYDHDSETVWVHEMARFQIGENLSPNDKQVVGIKKQFTTLPEGLIKQGFHARYKDDFILPNIVVDTKPHASPLKAPSKPEAGTEAEAVSGTEAGTEVSAAENPASNETEIQEACRQTWKQYATAYFDRYKTEPVRNAKVNGQVKQFVKRLGFTESPFVAAFYVQSNTAYYVQRGHSFDGLLADAEKLRTEWATGNVMTQTRARQIDKSQANKSSVNEALAILGEQE
jgi:hypothetical protein